MEPLEKEEYVNWTNVLNKKFRYSFSSLSTFQTCKHAWWLTYIADDTERKGNFFAEYGLLVHEVLEKFFRGEMEAFELSEYFDEQYVNTVTMSPPGFIKEQPYIERGHQFFEEFDFNRDDYEAVVIEDKIDWTIGDIDIVVKPDLVLKEKSTGKHLLVDYKTSIVEKNGKWDKKKIDGYKKQMIMYSKYLHLAKGIKIDEVWIWFIRQGTQSFFKFSISEDEYQEVENWIVKTVAEIVDEKEFPASPNKFFCSNLCSVAEYCKFKEE